MKGPGHKEKIFERTIKIPIDDEVMSSKKHFNLSTTAVLQNTAVCNVSDENVRTTFLGRNPILYPIYTLNQCFETQIEQPDLIG